jgi:hypothetical protein
MPGFVLTLPIATGKVEAWRRFCQELSGSHRQRFEASRQRLGVTRESLALVESPFGSTGVTTLEAHDVALALSEMMGSDRPFESWYRERLRDLHGVSMTRFEQFVTSSAPAQRQEVLFEWTLAGETQD